MDWSKQLIDHWHFVLNFVFAKQLYSNAVRTDTAMDVCPWHITLHYYFVFQVTANYRNSITIPKRGWASIRDIIGESNASLSFCNKIISKNEIEFLKIKAYFNKSKLFSCTLRWIQAAVTLSNLGPVVRTPVSANPGLNFNPGFFIFLSKALSQIIFSFLFRVSNYQIVGKEN